MQLLTCSLLALALLLPGVALGQSDVDLGAPVAGQWNVKASWDSADDYASVCFKRADTGEELGCTSSSVANVSSPTGELVTLLVTVTAPVPPSDVCIRAYALDDVGNQSADSSNCAIADFVAPGAPEIL